MGVVEIVKNNGEGEYDVEIIKDVRRAKVALDSLDEKITKNDELVVIYQAELDKLIAESNDITSEFNDYIDGYDDRITQIEIQQQAQADGENATLDQNEVNNLLIANNDYINTEAALTDIYNVEVSIREADIFAALPQDKPTLQASLDNYTAAFASDSDVRYDTHLKNIEKIEDDSKKLKNKAKERQHNDLIKSINTENNKYDSFINLTQANLSKLRDGRAKLERDIAETGIKSTDASKLKESLSKTVSDKVLKTLWIIDYDLELKVGEKYVTLEIERHADKSLIAPRTYEPVEDDVILLTNKIKELTEEYEKINTRKTKAEGDLAINKVEQAALIPFIKSLSVQAKLLALSNASIILASNVSALALLLEGVTKKINRTNEEKTRIQTLVTGSNIDLNPITVETTQHQPVMSSSAEATFFNKAILPAVQRWLPTFRHGTISAIDYGNDTCTVQLPFTNSIENDLPINEGVTEYSKVAVKYGTCNTGAFDVGDNVIIKFSKNWKTPVVVGFKDHPQPCGGGFYAKIYNNTEEWGWRKKLGAFVVEKNFTPKPKLCGNIDWLNKKGASELSWIGASGRYSYIYFNNSPIFRRGKVVVPENPDHLVLGACVTPEGNICVLYLKDSTINGQTYGNGGILIRVYHPSIHVILSEKTIIADLGLVTQHAHCNESGTKAVFLAFAPTGNIYDQFVDEYIIDLVTLTVELKTSRNATWLKKTPILADILNGAQCLAIDFKGDTIVRYMISWTSISNYTTLVPGAAVKTVLTTITHTTPFWTKTSTENMNIESLVLYTSSDYSIDMRSKLPISGIIESDCYHVTGLDLRHDVLFYIRERRSGETSGLLILNEAGSPENDFCQVYESHGKVISGNDIIFKPEINYSEYWGRDIVNLENVHTSATPYLSILPSTFVGTPHCVIFDKLSGRYSHYFTFHGFGLRLPAQDAFFDANDFKSSLHIDSDANIIYTLKKPKFNLGYNSPPVLPRTGSQPQPTQSNIIGDTEEIYAYNNDGLYLNPFKLNNLEIKYHEFEQSIARSPLIRLR